MGREEKGRRRRRGRGRGREEEEKRRSSRRIQRYGTWIFGMELLNLIMDLWFV